MQEELKSSKGNFAASEGIAGLWNIYTHKSSHYHVVRLSLRKKWQAISLMEMLETVLATDFPDEEK